MSIPGHGVDPYTVFGLVLRATILLGIVGVAQRMLRARVSAATRHLLWVSVLAALLVLPALGAALPRWPVAVRLAQWANEPPPVPAAAVPDPLTSMSSGVPATGPAAGATVAAERDRRSAAPSWPLLLFAGYLAGAGLLLARLGIHHAAAHRLIRRAEPIRDPAWTALLRTCADALGVAHPPSLRRSCEHSMPMASGIRRPVILLPDVAESWEPDRRRAVLLHELAHVARHDCVTQLLAELACAAYWFHPAVWWTARRLRIDRELACDDRVLAAGAEARSYAGHLLELAYTLGGRRGPALVVTMADRGQLEGRLLALLDAGRNRTSPGLRGQIASLALMTALVVPLARVDAAIVSLDEGAPVKAATSSLATAFPTAAGSAANDQQDAAGGRAAPDDDSTGTWEIRPADGNRVHIRMSENHSSSGQTIPLDAIDGLAAALRGGTGSPVHLTLRRDAGTFTFEGTFRGGVGAGTYAFAPDPSFAAELESRGIGRPSAREQKQLARHDVGLALLDELAAQGYAKPTVGDLVRAGSHGVGVGYVKEMGALGYRLGTIDPLIKMRDHGVGPGFVRDLGKAGLPRLSADDLVRLRDHGVTPEFVVALQQLGYDVRDVDALVTTRDHGVTPEYVREMAAAGYPKLSLKELVTTRDHGVNAELAKAMADLGYTNLPLADLVKARDHGVTASFARELQQLGYRPAAEDLVRARDHGVTPAYLKELKQLGYQNLSLDEAVGLRDHGLSADRIRRENERAGTRLPPDMLKRLN